MPDPSQTHSPTRLKSSHEREITTALTSKLHLHKHSKQKVNYKTYLNRVHPFERIFCKISHSCHMLKLLHLFQPLACCLIKKRCKIEKEAPTMDLSENKLYRVKTQICHHNCETSGVLTWHWKLVNQEITNTQDLWRNFLSHLWSWAVTWQTRHEKCGQTLSIWCVNI